MIKTLIVDDDARFRRLVKGLLSREPEIAVVGEAVDGREALASARDISPDLVLMDIRMPGMNGIDAARQLKKEMPEVRVIMLTLYDFEEYRDAARAAGAGGYVLKRSINGKLITAIKGALSGLLSNTDRTGN